VCATIIRAAHHVEDWRWVEERALQLLQSADVEVRGAAVTALGHLARIHRRLDLERVVPALAALRNDPALEGRVEDAMDDIRTFIEPGGPESAS
jgi:hypothetical protein